MKIKLMPLAVALAMGLASTAPAKADCYMPPYEATSSGYVAFIQAFGKYFESEGEDGAAVYLPCIPRMKRRF
jgi:hypothetical protein